MYCGMLGCGLLLCYTCNESFRSFESLSIPRRPESPGNLNDKWLVTPLVLLGLKCSLGGSFDLRCKSGNYIIKQYNSKHLKFTLVYNALSASVIVHKVPADQLKWIRRSKMDPLYKF